MHSLSLAAIDCKNECMMEPVQKYNSNQHLPIYRLDCPTFVGLIKKIDLKKTLLNGPVHILSAATAVDPLRGVSLYYSSTLIWQSYNRTPTKHYFTAHI